MADFEGRVEVSVRSVTDKGDPSVDDDHLVCDLVERARFGIAVKPFVPGEGGGCVAERVLVQSADTAASVK
jgi:hypothetical protein